MISSTIFLLYSNKRITLLTFYIINDDRRKGVRNTENDIYFFIIMSIMFSDIKVWKLGYVFIEFYPSRKCKNYNKVCS
jgi:hypothetical protein